MTQLVQFSNNAATTLNGGITNVAVSLVVTSSTGFPAISGTQYFYATLRDASNNLEIIKVTAVSGTTWTIARGQDGTTGRAYSNLDAVELRPTAAGLNDLYTQAGNAPDCITAGASKTTPVDADALPLYDSAATTTSSKLTWANLKATLQGVTWNNAAAVTNGLYTTSSHYIGTTSIAFNRASATQSLTGVNIDGSSGSCTGNAATVTNGFYTTSSFYIGTTAIAVNRGSAGQSLTGINIDGSSGSCTGNAATSSSCTGAAASVSGVTLQAGLGTGNTPSFVDVTITSDERLKTNWRDLGEGLLAKLAAVKHGIYDRTDLSITQVGVSAQSLQAILPEAVITREDGFLQISQSATLALLVELATVVQKQEKRIAWLEAQL